MNKWITERKPETDGEYLVTLETVNGAGEILRWVDTRYYATPGQLDEWTMEGESPSMYHWTTETGSLPHEHVIAWMYKPEPYEP